MKIKESFELIKDKCIFEGHFFQHTAEWYTYNKSRENSLILVYEDMKKDLRGNVKKISDFLGKNLSDEALDKIAEKSTFESVVKDPNLNRRGAPHFKEERARFLRKGKVGDWQDYFTEEQNAYIEAESKTYIEPIGLKFNYY